MSEIDQRIARVLDSQQFQPPTTPWGIRNVLWVAGLTVAERWAQIAEAPIPGPNEAPDGFIFHCLLQTSHGSVSEGLARYVHDARTRGKKNIRVLRWYTGCGAGERVCSDPRYYQPLPQPRKD